MTLCRICRQYRCDQRDGDTSVMSRYQERSRIVAFVSITEAAAACF